MASMLELPILGTAPRELVSPEEILPLTDGKTCGSGCCSSSVGAHIPGQSTAPTAGPRIQIPFAERRLNLDAIPSHGMVITTIDLDVTVECNLRCTYCFKEKWTEHMEEQVAYDALTWLIHASGDAKEVHVTFMGGEPLLRFKLIKQLVPFGKRRAAQHGKTMHFGMTTNGTLVTDEVVAFWKKWGLGFHTSIDGTPDIQDRNRPTAGGRGSARLVERAVPKILGYAPNTCARCTVVPSSAGSLARSYRYFRSLGYLDIAFVPGAPSLWDAASLRLYEDQYRATADLLMDDLRRGDPVSLKGIDDYAASQLTRRRSPDACGAGRGTVLVDIHGDLWPCHRWNKGIEAEWRIGSIYEQFTDAARQPLDVPSFVDRLENDCGACAAQLMCSGGCPAENLEETGSIYRRHDNACELTRVWYRVGKYVYDTMTAEHNATFAAVYCDRDQIGIFH